MDAGKLFLPILRRDWPLSSLVRFYYRVRFGPIGRKVINGGAEAAFERYLPRLDALQQRAVSELRTNGVFVGHISDLLSSQLQFGELQREAELLFNRPEIERQIRERKSRDGWKKWYVIRALGRRRDGRKTWYVIRALGRRFKVALSKCVAGAVLNERLLDVVNSYLGLWSRIRYIDFWYNLPTSENEPPIESERWHRDQDDRNFVTLFLYLDDTDHDAGPFMYMRETQRGGRFGDVFPVTPPFASYPPYDAIRRRIPPEQTVTCTGESGTFILYDGTGFHRGGRATGKRRLIFTARYISDTGLNWVQYRLPEVWQYETLSPSARYAIRARESPADTKPSPRR